MNHGCNRAGGRVLLLIILCLSCLGPSGCGPRAARMDKQEINHPLIQKAIELIKYGDEDAAIALFKKSLDKEPTLARAHLELAFLYDKPTRDYVRAVHYYQRYLELRPDSDKKEMIEERIRMAKLAFAATLIPQSVAGAERMMSLEKENAVIKMDNEYLRNEMRDMQVRMDALAAAAASNTVRVVEVAPPAATVLPTTPPQMPNPPPVVSETIQEKIHVKTVAAPPVAKKRLPAVEARPVPVTGNADVGDRRPAATAKSAVKQRVKIYYVQKGDTLSRIALKVYGDSSRWRDILSSNSTSVRNEKDLRVGMRLNIPP